VFFFQIVLALNELGLVLSKTKRKVSKTCVFLLLTLLGIENLRYVECSPSVGNSFQPCTLSVDPGKAFQHGCGATKNMVTRKYRFSKIYLFCVSQYKLKRCSNKECCKQCRYVMFKGTMTKWPYKN